MLQTRANKKKRKVQECSTSEVSNKRIKLTNGFIVENCIQAKPSTTNETHIKNNNLESKTNEKADGNKKTKHKLQLGESVQENDNILNLEDMTSWAQFQIPDEILKGLAEMAFKRPTKIQELTLPPAMLGKVLKNCNDCYW